MSMMTQALAVHDRPIQSEIDRDMRLVLADVEDVTGVSAADLPGTSRKWHLVDARQLAYLCLRSRKHSQAAVARAFGKLCHGTISHGCNRIADLAKIEKKTARRVELLRERGYAI